MAHHTKYGDRGSTCWNHYDACKHRAGAISAACSQSTDSSGEPDLTQLLSTYDANSVTEAVSDEDYIVGAGYLVKETPQAAHDEKAYNEFEIEIDHWIFTFKHVFLRQPVISMTVRIPRDTPNSFALSNVKAMMRDIEGHSENTMQNTISAALAMIQEIDKGYVPYSEQILKHYGIHPDFQEQENAPRTQQAAIPTKSKRRR